MLRGAIEPYPPPDGNASDWYCVPTGDGRTAVRNIVGTPAVGSAEWWLSDVHIPCPFYHRGYLYSYWRDNVFVRRRLPSYEALVEISQIADELYTHPAYLGMPMRLRAAQDLSTFIFQLRTLVVRVPSKATYARLLSPAVVGDVIRVIRRLREPPEGLLARLERLQVLADGLEFVDWDAMAMPPPPSLSSPSPPRPLLTPKKEDDVALKQ